MKKLRGLIFVHSNRAVMCMLEKEVGIYKLAKAVREEIIKLT